MFLMGGGGDFLFDERAAVFHIRLMVPHCVSHLYLSALRDALLVHAVGGLQMQWAIVVGPRTTLQHPVWHSMCVAGFMSVIFQVFNDNFVLFTFMPEERKSTTNSEWKRGDVTQQLPTMMCSVSPVPSAWVYPSDAPCVPRMAGLLFVSFAAAPFLFFVQCFVLFLFGVCRCCQFLVLFADLVFWSVCRLLEG